jgi:predicted acylesterase/phospholipase RssA
LSAAVERKDKTALVLGAGGVFGAYQVGVWRALADSFQPDLVVGASIGSINGWLIAGGCSPQELEDLWLDSGAHLHLRPRMPRRWSQGCLNLEPVETRVAELFARFTPQTEYAAVVTDLLRIQPRLFTAGQMTWQHMMASCAVPGAFDLRCFEGRYYADGGLLGALPLWAALSLGATRIIAVHSLPEAPFPFRAARWAGKALSRSRPIDPSAVEVIRIEPERPLGQFFHLLKYDRSRVQSWIAQGERDGLRAKQSVLKCFERQ